MINQDRMQIENYNLKHETAVQIRLNDVDMNRHVNNSMYHHYFDYARVKYFEDIIGKDINWDEESMVVANINIDFFKPVYLHDELVVYTRVISLGNKSLKMLQYLYENNTKEVRSRNMAVLVAFNPTAKTSIHIPSYWREAIHALEESL